MVVLDNGQINAPRWTVNCCKTKMLNFNEFNIVQCCHHLLKYALFNHNMHTETEQSSVCARSTKTSHKIHYSSENRLNYLKFLNNNFMILEKQSIDSVNCFIYYIRNCLWCYSVRTPSVTWADHKAYCTEWSRKKRTNFITPYWCNCST